ncbi:hypothetical protein C6497_04875 [Candidatus Poribacteria bacterium]|nr:MAG: hypothetical protein C6497_04875 [Candidatus Poribacteria bacterium]
MRVRLESTSYVIILLLLCFHFYIPVASQENALRDEFTFTESNHRVSYDQYQKELKKILQPDSVMSFNIDYIILPIAIIAIGIVAIYFVRQIRMNYVFEVRNEETDPQDDSVETEKSALARAETAVEANDFREALRFLYISAVFHLQERGVLPYDKSITNREYLRISHTDLDLQKTLRPVITVFDEVWYGYKHCDQQTVESYRETLKDVYARNS